MTWRVEYRPKGRFRWFVFREECEHLRGCECERFTFWESANYYARIMSEEKAS